MYGSHSAQSKRVGAMINLSYSTVHARPDAVSGASSTHAYASHRSLHLAPVRWMHINENFPAFPVAQLGQNRCSGK
jgi:hypothetical protein